MPSPEPQECDTCAGLGTVKDLTIESPNKDVSCESCGGTGITPENDDE